MADEIFSPDELEADKTQASPEDNAAPVETQEQKDQRERDEQGRFKAKEPTPEGQAPEAEAGKPPQGTVPQGALHAEREKRKGVEQELAAAREQLAAIAKMREQIASRKPAELPAADDPAALEHLRQRVAEQDQNLNRIGQHIDTQAANQAEAQQLGAVVSASEAEYRQQQPDYDNAIQHVVEARARELALYGLAPAQIQQTIADEAMDIVRSAVAQGRNPAELGYQIALSRGYRPQQAEDQPAAQPTSGAAATVAALGAAKASSRSLGQAAGSTPQQLNAEAIVALSPDEFERLYMTPEGRRQIDAIAGASQ